MPERGRARDRTGGYAGTWPPRETALASPSRSPSGIWPALVARLRAGACGSGRRTTVALGAGGIWCGHCGLFFSRSRADSLGCRRNCGGSLRRGAVAAAASAVSSCGHGRAMAAGFAVATVKTARVAHVVLTRPMYSPSLKGFVETREVRERTDRFVLRVVQMDDPWRHVKLDRVRLSVKKGTAPDVGSFVELKARLQPPLAYCSVVSGDVRRYPWFRGIRVGTHKAIPSALNL